jgi:hypothetical protein
LFLRIITTEQDPEWRSGVREIVVPVGVDELMSIERYGMMMMMMMMIMMMMMMMKRMSIFWIEAELKIKDGNT